MHFIFKVIVFFSLNSPSRTHDGQTNKSQHNKNRRHLRPVPLEMVQKYSIPRPRHSWVGKMLGGAIYLVLMPVNTNCQLIAHNALNQMINFHHLLAPKGHPKTHHSGIQLCCVRLEQPLGVKREPMVVFICYCRAVRRQRKLDPR